jgi:tRNA(fMet)-specific endonuclease VapC
VSDLMRNPHQSKVVEHIARVGEGSVFMSIIVACELQFGYERNPSQRLAERLAGAFNRIPVEPFVAPAHLHYAAIRADLERSGQKISSFDTLIAAHARALGATLVTGNEREFTRVPVLTVENWLR